MVVVIIICTLKGPTKRTSMFISIVSQYWCFVVWIPGCIFFTVSLVLYLEGFLVYFPAPWLLTYALFHKPKHAELNINFNIHICFHPSVYHCHLNRLSTM